MGKTVHRHAPPGSLAFPKHAPPVWVMVSFILAGSTTKLSIQLGTPCHQALCPTTAWSLARRDVLLPQLRLAQNS